MAIDYEYGDDKSYLQWHKENWQDKDTISSEICKLHNALTVT